MTLTNGMARSGLQAGNDLITISFATLGSDLNTNFSEHVLSALLSITLATDGYHAYLAA